MATMHDVARVAGVSTTTVSHVLNGTRRVNAETRERVEQAIEQTGYRANRLARSLASGRTRTVGLCISAVTNPYFGNLAHSIELNLAAAGYTLVLGDGHDDVEVEQRAVRSLLDYRVDGLLLAPTRDSRTTTIPRIAETGTPLVLIDRFLDVDCDQVASEGFRPAYEITEHLVELGHRRIAVLTGVGSASSTQERLDGFTAALEAHGIELDPRLVADGASNTDVAHQALLRVLDLDERPTALVTLNNSMTIGAMRAVRDRGVRVPDDLALVCFDDFEWADLFQPRLTAVAQDIDEMGRSAVELLLSRIENPGHEARQIRVGTHLRHRNSCGCS